MKRIFTLILFIAFILSGCEGGNIANPEKNQKQSESQETSPAHSSLTTVSDLKMKYKKKEEKQYLTPIYNVNYNQVFTFKFNSNIYSTDAFPHSEQDLAELFKEDAEDRFKRRIVTVHTDARCLYESEVSTYEKVKDPDASQSVLTVSSFDPVLTTFDSSRDKENSWGNAPIYYICIRYDLDAETPTKLDNPIVVPFTIKSPLQSPNANYQIDAEGRFKLVWNKVKGAKKYNVYNVMSMNNAEKNNGAEQGYKHTYPYLIGTVTDTEFQDFASDGDQGLLFVGDEPDDYRRKATIAQNMMVQGEYYVTAVDQHGNESNFSPAVSTFNLSKTLVTGMKELHELYYSSFQTIDDLPKKIKLTAIDNATTLERDLIYEKDIQYDKDGFALIPYKVKGTAISGTTLVLSFDEQKWSNYIHNQDARDHSNGGLVEPENAMEYAPDFSVVDNSKNNSDDLIKRQKENTQKQLDEGNKEYVPLTDTGNDYKINADSALEEYLALNLIAANKEVSLKAFPEALVIDFLADTLQKVQYQNPLILDIESYGFDYKTSTLYIDYSDSKNNIAKKQKEIMKEAHHIISQMITDDMSDDQKRQAIYDYLNDHAKYDDAALNDAKKNDYKNVDKKFNDSFTAYGIMVKKVGVCASYAAAYKLLSDLSGLNSIVVTGYLGGVPHAWNKVEINGEWYNVDPTNNGTNSGVLYLLYNSDDETAEDLEFTFDKAYWTDEGLKQFTSSDSSLDYYRRNGLEVSSPTEYKNLLLNFLKDNDQTFIVRLSNDVSEDDVIQVIQDVYNESSNIKLENTTIRGLLRYLIMEE
ncbi:transglutaminase domain-containing protein [Paenibacillus ihumii]|uniref:transglutaminase domain-containing protein n=1 Tax=Paenibacillus ihumii TaxID=687436 RepID=UPI0006D7CB31|nr:transglutaminase domain-containing protein [Paenibacillus ihumii]